MCREITSSETSTIKATKIVEKFKTCCRRAKKGSGARERQYNSTTNESESGLHELCWKRAAVEREKLKYAHHYMNRDSIFLNFRYDAKKIIHLSSQENLHRTNSSVWLIYAAPPNKVSCPQPIWQWQRIAMISSQIFSLSRVSLATSLIYIVEKILNYVLAWSFECWAFWHANISISMMGRARRRGEAKLFDLCASKIFTVTSPECIIVAIPKMKFLYKYLI